MRQRYGGEHGCRQHGPHTLEHSKDRYIGAISLWRVLPERLHIIIRLKRLAMQDVNQQATQKESRAYGVQSKDRA